MPSEFEKQFGLSETRLKSIEQIQRRLNESITLCAHTIAEIRKKIGSSSIDDETASFNLKKSEKFGKTIDVNISIHQDEFQNTAKLIEHCIGREDMIVDLDDVGRIINDWLGELSDRDVFNGYTATVQFRIEPTRTQILSGKNFKPGWYLRISNTPQHSYDI